MNTNVSIVEQSSKSSGQVCHVNNQPFSSVDMVFLTITEGKMYCLLLSDLIKYGQWFPIIQLEF